MSTLTTLFGDIADAIREKTGETGTIVASNFPNKILSIQTGSGTEDATAVASDILKDKTAYARGSKLTGTIESLNTLIYNVSTNDQVINAGKYLSGNQTFKGVKTTGISASNIKDGATVTVGDSISATSISNVTGTFSDSSTITGTGVTPANSGDILSGKGAFLDGAQITGTMSDNGAPTPKITTQNGTYSISAGYYSGGTVTAEINSATLNGSVSTHEITTEPAITPNVSGEVMSISTVTPPSGIAGVDYWDIVPSGIVSTTGVSTAKAKAVVSGAGYANSDSSESSEDNVEIDVNINACIPRYILKSTITNNTSGGTSSGTINRGSQIKISSGYNASDVYYTAQANSGTLTETTNGTFSCDGYTNVTVNIPTYDGSVS